MRNYDTIWRDRSGYVRLGWMFLIIAIGAVIAIAIIALGIVKPINETACNQKAAQLHVVGADYRFWSDTCYLTLANGKTIPADSYRVIQREPVSR